MSKKFLGKVFDFSKEHPAAFNLIGGAVCGVLLFGVVDTFEKYVKISTCTAIANDCEKILKEEAEKKSSEQPEQ